MSMCRRIDFSSKMFDQNVNRSFQVSDYIPSLFLILKIVFQIFDFKKNPGFYSSNFITKNQIRKYKSPLKENRGKIIPQF